MRWSFTVTACATIAALGGCARTNAASAPADRMESPRMVQTGSWPDLSIHNVPSAIASGRAPVRLQIEVLIDPEGRPDMKTLRVTGPGSMENRAPIERWIEQATFEPARRGGRPVSGLYRTSIEVRIKARR